LPIYFLYCKNIFSLNCSFCFNQCWLSLISKIDITVGRILDNVKWTSMLKFNFLFNFLMIRGTSNTKNHGKTNILEFFIHVPWLMLTIIYMVNMFILLYMLYCMNMFSLRIFIWVIALSWSHNNYFSIIQTCIVAYEREQQKIMQNVDIWNMSSRSHRTFSFEGLYFNNMHPTSRY